ncbi:nitrate- and nitrite sensing domain-containing protein [Kitasatospora sp. NPDC093806]|uniref:sensor histidine kinase n=1 Tax=Kitasatospora sp. NPDC093806 TaxID=3155075 RepID=UPI0034295369
MRTALLVLSLVPSLAIAALWAVTSGVTIFAFQRQAAQGLLAERAGQPSNIVYYNLQEERRLSAEALARPGSVTEQLKNQRRLTDEAVQKFQALSGETADSAPAEVRTAVAETRRAMEKLGDQRAAIDKGAVDQQSVYAYYTDLITVDLRLFTALSHVDNGEVTWVSKTLLNSFWAKEMLAREDAILARGWPSGRLSASDYQLVQQAIGAQEHLFTVQVVPYLPAAERATWQELTSGPAWQAKAAVEQALGRPATADAGGSVRLPQLQDQWRQAVDQLNPQLVQAIEKRTDGVVEVGKGSIIALLTRVLLTTVIGLVAVVAVVVTGWRLTRSLRRRIKDLHGQAQELERTLPEVVERLARGEQVDVEAESRAITAGPHAAEPGTGAAGEAADGAGTGAGSVPDTTTGTDELAQLGQALNLARTSALETAVRQAEQHRGFERLLQRIARRTQLLIGQQLRKLDELERRHEDPEVLEGLFDLDHLTARLRRYEENLVIMAGGQPQRKWRKPVPLLDVLRSAQGEVQEYRRIVLDVEGHPWLSERAVGPIAHVVAELMENAATFSKPPTPVDVRAAVVGRGLAIEIEDRGLGMDPEQYDAANKLMADALAADALAAEPPRTDMLARADDIRLGFHVVARLAAAVGLQIEFRPSAFGGTRAVVLVPGELVLDGDAGLPDVAAVTPLPRRARPERGAEQWGTEQRGALAPLASVTEMPAPTELPPSAGVTPLTGLTDVHGLTGLAATAGVPSGAEEAPTPAVAVDEQQERAARVAPTPVPAPGQADEPSGSDWFTAGPRPAPAQAFAHVEYVPPSDDEVFAGPVPSGRPHGGGDGDGYLHPFAGPDAPGMPGTPGTPGVPGHDVPPYGTPFSGTSGTPHGAPSYDAPAYPDIAYATVTPAEAPYADEQYRPADHYRLAERRQHHEPAPAPAVETTTTPSYPAADPVGPAEPPVGLQAPLPQRIRQASLAAELRVPPPPRSQYPGTGGTGTSGSAGPFQRPARRSGATIGAFQRQSRAARGLDQTGPDHATDHADGHTSGHTGSPFAGAVQPDPATPTSIAGPPTPATGPAPWALPAADPRTTRTEDQS